MGISLTHYLGGTGQSEHSHDFTQISFLLAGSMLERLDGRDRELHGPSIGVKPAGTPHRDVWGPSGTLIFTLKLDPAETGMAEPLPAPDWSGMKAAPTVQRLVATCLTAGRVELSLEAAEDLLALVGTPEPAHAAAPPWLERARCQIHDAPDIVAIEEVAREAGVGRAHLSRMFRRCFGLPPSVYRQQVLAARAVAAIARSDAAFAGAALDAGYADQAHMNRGIKAATGITPGRLRRLLRN